MARFLGMACARCGRRRDGRAIADLHLCEFCAEVVEGACQHQGVDPEVFVDRYRKDQA